jgi:hypothetical protein
VHKPHELVLTVVTLMAYGCPVQAIVAAFALDERTVARWQRESGYQCRRVHEHLVQAGGVLLSQVQADELRIRIVGGVVWLASAISVTSRLWLGGVVQLRREFELPYTLALPDRDLDRWRLHLALIEGAQSLIEQIESASGSNAVLAELKAIDLERRRRIEEHLSQL